MAAPFDPDVLQLLPVKLVPGFIAIDFVHGCAGCNFCVARRSHLVDQIFDRGHFATFDRHGQQLYEILSRLPSFSCAQVPLRIGNDSDFAFQRHPVRQLVRQLPATYPAVVLTRFPLERQDVKLFSERRLNTLLKVTVTPRSRYLDSPADPYRVLESIQEVRGNVLITLGPLVEDNFSAAESLIDALPNGGNISVYLKRLDKEGLPRIAAVPELPISKLRKLEKRVTDRGFRLNSFMLCLIFGHLRREDPRSADVPENEARHCFTCASHRLCGNDELIADERLSEIGAQLGLRVLAVEHTGFRTYGLTVDLPCAYGDEAYFSYMLGRKVRLSTTAVGTRGHTALATQPVLERWSHQGFFPARHLEGLIIH